MHYILFIFYPQRVVRNQPNLMLMLYSKEVRIIDEVLGVRRLTFRRVHLSYRIGKVLHVPVYPTRFTMVTYTRIVGAHSQNEHGYKKETYINHFPNY